MLKIYSKAGASRQTAQLLQEFLAEVRLAAMSPLLLLLRCTLVQQHPDQAHPDATFAIRAS